MHRFKNAGGEDGGEEEETNTTTTNTKNDNTNNNNAVPGKVNVSASPSEKIINYAYRHGMSGKELKKRAKELKKRQMLDRETKRLERRERRNSATTTSQVEEEEAFFNSATIPIPAISEYAFSPSSASPRMGNRLLFSGSPLSLPPLYPAGFNSYESDKEVAFERYASSSLDESRPHNLLSPTKYKQNRKELRRLFGKLEFETLDKSSMDRVFVSCEIGKKSTKTVQLSEFLETPNAPYHAVRRVERNNSGCRGGVEVLWDVNFDASAAAKAENESKSLNINNNDDDDGGGGDDGERDDDDEEEEEEEERAQKKKPGRRTRPWSRTRHGDAARDAHKLFARRANEFTTIREFATTAACVAALREDGRTIWATDLSQRAVCLTESALRAARGDDATSASASVVPEKLAIVFGTESGAFVFVHPPFGFNI